MCSMHDCMLIAPFVPHFAARKTKLRIDLYRYIPLTRCFGSNVSLLSTEHVQGKQEKNVKESFAIRVLIISTTNMVFIALAITNISSTKRTDKYNVVVTKNVLASPVQRSTTLKFQGLQRFSSSVKPN